MLFQPVRLVLHHSLQLGTGGNNDGMLWRSEELLWVSFVCGVNVSVAWVLRWGGVSGFRLAFSVPLVPVRQGSRLGRWLCEMEGLLAFELACDLRLFLIGDGLWER